MVTVATGHIAVTAEVDPSHSPGGATNVNPDSLIKYMVIGSFGPTSAHPK